MQGLQTAALSHELDADTFVAPSASVVLHNVQTGLLAVNILESRLDLQASSTSRTGNVEAIQFRVSAEDTSSVRVQFNSRQLCLLEEPCLDLDHCEPTEDRLKVVFSNVLKVNQLVALQPLPPDDLVHFGENAVRQTTCNTLARAELLEKVLPDGLLRTAWTLLTGKHEVACHSGYLLPQLVVSVEDVGVEGVVVFCPQHGLQVRCELGEAHTSRPQVHCDLVNIKPSFGQGQASLAVLEGSRDRPEGFGVNLFQPINRSL